VIAAWTDAAACRREDPELCAVEDCQGIPRARGWCNAHFKRWVRHGSPTAGGPMRIADPTQRLLAKIEKTETCWLWRGQVNNKGYGLFWLNGSKRAAHVVSFLLHGGHIPDGLELDHLCRVTLCVRPDHLEPVTHAENQRRMGLARTQCIHGHPYTPENTYRGSNGRRRCRECARQRDRERVPRKRKSA
jgi:hypothetical protein